jgi:predicted AAA+ superfamily ATPase
MYPRDIILPSDNSFFLFGPRGVGKSTLIRERYPEAIYFDLLDFQTYREFLANPSLLENKLAKHDPQKFVVLDEIQKVPDLLNEVHRLIESPKHFKFILTGSSARKLRRGGANLLAGRAYLYYLHPLTSSEIGEDFDFARSLRYGTLPKVYLADEPKKYLESYVGGYLREEVVQEGLTRNLTAFSKFLQVASFSVGGLINTNNIAREVYVDRKVIENYFQILEDMMIGVRLPAFTRRAKRQVVTHPKFYFFDAGIYQTLRPTGPLDVQSEINGPALENLFFQHLIAINDNLKLGYQFSFFRTTRGQEIDFIAYGERGFHAFEMKMGTGFSSVWTRALTAFGNDYPEASLHIVYGGSSMLYHKNITIHPFETILKELPSILMGK